MSRYYFHILNGREPNDELGVELADLDAAKTEALRFAGEVVKEDMPKEIWQGKSWEMRVTDSPSPETGHIFLTIHLSGT